MSLLLFSYIHLFLFFGFHLQVMRVSVFVWLISPSIISSRTITLLEMAAHHYFLWLNNIPVCVCARVCTHICTHTEGFPFGSDGKESTCNAGDLGSIPGLGRPTWRREWLPTLVFLLGESHEQRTLTSYTPWVAKSQTRWETNTFTFSHIYIQSSSLSFCLLLDT